jgi:preprotein translocase subunit SecD
MNKIALALILAFISTSYSAETQNPASIFEIRQVFDQPATDTVEMELLTRTGPKEKLYVGKTAAITAKTIERAAVIKDPLTGNPEIAISFTKEGKKQFAELTRANVGRRLAIILDGKIQNAPIIRDEISGGKAVITGNFTETEAKELASKINTVQAPPLLER